MKGRTTVRKLLALLLIAGLCSVGCGPTKKSESTKPGTEKKTEPMTPGPKDTKPTGPTGKSEPITPAPKPDTKAAPKPETKPSTKPGESKENK
jgi:hypothetical protein